MKRIFALLIAVSLILSVCLFPVCAADVGVANDEVSLAQKSEETLATPRIVHSYEKTVTKTYTSYTSAPATLEYEEYKTGTWFSGTLHLQSIVRQSNGTWLATYKGLLHGVI